MKQGKITISTLTHKIVTVDGEEHTLRSKEYQMLCLLLERAPLCVTRREIISHVWSGTYSADATINQTMKSIRRKLGDKDFTLIQTIPRMGYQIEHPELFALEPIVNNDPVHPGNSVSEKKQQSAFSPEDNKPKTQNIHPANNHTYGIKRWGGSVTIGILCFICGMLWHGGAPTLPILLKSKVRDDIPNSLISAAKQEEGSAIISDDYRFVCKYSWHGEEQFSLVCTRVKLSENEAVEK
ncbi:MULTISPECIES: winged helix-turn-helix domain-containing protein [Hafnia]|uniref:Winged helix family transcriptional regulator n=2 Tax=Hafnia TaxID=568 RepID=A0A4Q9EIE9_9GAMM|nr:MULTISPECIES: winged helix-turn-helix domain-containing protein [Hafnia]EHM38530.1 transcriptional regulatory protein [Hafnia alvei ATCC 51873]OFS09326.1 transcriptional regulator [Hafnia sp. HMSC23F03]QQE45671.1 winged helix-turn-helix transcriptional regulator [Hafnia alvei]TBM25147.1 winged helix family transcriptional regulator [Hafnia paralvei]